MMKFGFGKVCITPEIGTRLMGQPTQEKSDGKYNDLYARSFFLQSKENNVLIVACDLLLFPQEVMDNIRHKISGKTGIRFENIIIHTTHTHAGPAVTDIFSESGVNEEINEKIICGIIKSAVDSFEKRQSGKIGIGREYIYDISFNRRYIMKDGTVEMHPHKDDPNLLEAEGPNDPELNSIIVFDENNNIIGALANFPCHLTFMERSNKKFSADFPFYAEEYLKRNLGNDDFIMLYLNGPCGNLCQVNVENKSTFEVGDKYSRKTGEKFGKAIMNIIDSCKFSGEEIQIDTIYREIKIPIREITQEMVDNAKETLEKFKNKSIEDFDLSNYGIESYKDRDVISAGQLLETDYWKNMSANELLSLSKKYRDNKLVNLPLTVIRIGKLLLVTIPAELFVEFSLELKEYFKQKYESIIIVELTNGWVGYIPTKKAFSYNTGYEVQFLSSSKLCEDAGDIVVDEIIRMEKEIS